MKWICRYVERHLDELENQEDINVEASIKSSFYLFPRVFPCRYLNHRKALWLWPQLDGEMPLWLEFSLLSAAQKKKVTLCTMCYEDTGATLGGLSVNK